MKIALVYIENKEEETGDFKILKEQYYNTSQEGEEFRDVEIGAFILVNKTFYAVDNIVYQIDDPNFDYVELILLREIEKDELFSNE